jgi:hypothetical protein
VKIDGNKGGGGYRKIDSDIRKDRRRKKERKREIDRQRERERRKKKKENYLVGK